MHGVLKVVPPHSFHCLQLLLGQGRARKMIPHIQFPRAEHLQEQLFSVTWSRQSGLRVSTEAYAGSEKAHWEVDKTGFEDQFLAHAFELRILWEVGIILINYLLKLFWKSKKEKTESTQWLFINILWILMW